jgi:hypothetical protein
MGRAHCWKPEFRQFDFVFKTNFNRNYRYPSNIHPWAFGLSNRILQETDHLPPFHERERVLLVNFRVGHTVRRAASEKLFPRLHQVLPVKEVVDGFGNAPMDPYHHMQWAQSGRRHYPEYYDRLKRQRLRLLREEFANVGPKTRLVNSWAE